MITNFPAKPAYNPGGYASFKFIPVIHILTFPDAVNHVISSPITTSQAWLTGYSTYETLLFDEENIKSAHGSSYRPEISGFVPGEYPELADLLFRMEQMKHFVVQLTNSRGAIRVVGSPVMPLDFIANYSSGKDRISSKGNSFKFVGDTLNRAPFYQL